MFNAVVMWVAIVLVTAIVFFFSQWALGWIVAQSTLGIPLVLVSLISLLLALAAGWGVYRRRAVWF